MRRYPRSWRLFIAALLLSPEAVAPAGQDGAGRWRMRATAENEGRSAAGINSEPIQRSALSRTAEPPPYYSCPATYESPPVLVRDNSTVNLKRSAPDSLCTLVRVTFAAPNDDEEEFVRQDQVGRNILAPAGRSYHSLPWERVAGPYRSSVHYDCGHDDEDDNREMLHVCQVTLPPLGSNQAFVLLTYNRTLSQRNAVARFLQQTTFGPTKEEIDSWDYSAGDDAFATWTQEQMYTVPLTSHREFWRRRVRQRFDRAAPVGRPAHPCESNSRWREVAFTEWDVGSTVTMRPLVASANGVNAPYILYIDGQLRTIAPNFRFSEASYGIDISHGYEVCQMPQARIGGQLILRQPDGSCRDVYGGNMRVMLDDNVITTTPDIVVLDLPSFGGTNSSLTRDDERAGFIFARGIQDQIEKCDGIPISGSVAPVFGRVPSTIPGEAGAFLLHDPHLVLSDNSPDSPLSDGGGELSQATGGVMMCSNAPPSFLNAEGCQLSDEPMACTADDSNAPSIELTLNHETVVQLSKLSGRYIYVVDGLRVEVGDVLSPCVEGSMSRWMRTDKTQLLCGGDVVLASGTISVLSDLLSTSRDENSFLRDVHFPEASETSCHASDIGAIGMELFVDGTCFRHVHPDHFNVHDFTYWSGEKAHPGNAIRKLANLPNPIKAFLDIASSSILYFPSHHTMDRWSTFKPDFHYVGRFGDIINFRDLSDSLRIRAVAEGFGAVSEADKEVPKLVCGSHGEVSNELSRVMEGFDVSFDREIDIYTDSYYVQQRKTAWTSVVLNSQDQLRQRVAWALSQILVVTTFDIEAKRNTEMFLSFYDIFARNAFGSYSEILKEVIYSPLMGEMLTYLESKSSAFVWEEEKRRVFADENMAREVLQLFTTGLVHLNVDGTPKLDADGGTIPVYNQEDILSYARGWTGFRRRRKRSNTEDFKSGTYVNKIDPMVIVPQWRDSRPKTDLSGGFIGDRYPLCSDLPFKMFLRKGAKYQLLGGSILPHFHKELELDVDGASDTILELDPTASSLHKALCNPLENGECTYPNEVVLEKALDCAGMECLIDAARMVELAGGVVFEYVPPPCVELTFFGEGRVARSRKGEVDVCADPRLPVAGSACCPADSDRARWECIFTGELFTHQSASNRCVSEGEEVCSFSKVPSSSCDECCVEDAFLWTDDDCRLQIKVSRSGHVALVHNTADLYGESSNRNPSHLSLETTEYFRVFWANSRYPSIDDGCNEAGVSSFCRPLNEDECLCDIAVAEEEVFSSGMPTKEQVLHDLFIGHVDPSNYGNGTYFEEKENDVIAYHSLSAGPGIGPSSVFLAEDEVEGKLFLKNTMSSVRVGESLGSLSFRNPPKFMSSFDPQPKDAMYETDVVLESYIKHHNTAPFIATRLIQRFGMSNPSPRFVQTVATAFKTGTYTFTSPRNQQSIVFGDSRLGSIGAAVAAIILDRESRAVVLDADPSHGALKEPVLSLLGFMRSMRYQANKGHELVKLHGVQDRIGQMAFESPTVFSFMLPHYSPLGPVADALLVAPEAQLMAMSSVVASMNAVFSLINFGLTSCDYGLGGRPTQGCSRLYEGDYSRSQGRLKYKPAAATAEEIVDELATLLNSGRLSDQSRDIIIDMYGRLSDKEAALRMAQKLIVATPEYATTSATPQSVGLERKAANVATTCRPYKAVVVIMLEGACDSQNMLVPHSGCEDRIGKDLYAEYATVRNYLAIDKDDLLPIESNNTAQPCSSFGLHPLLKGLHALYSEESALFLANIGMLPKSFSRASHVRGLKMNLYSHEHMQSEVKKVDAYRNFSGTGVLGRLADVMSRSGLRTGSVALDEVSEASTGRITRPMVVNEKNVENFAPMPTSGLFKAAVRRLNDATSFRSSMMGETWSRIITDSMSENALIYNTLQDFETSIDFSKDSISRQLETVARLISTRRCRGVEREVFYVKSGGWDTHDNMKKRLDENFQELDESITSFVKEMKYQGMFKDVVMMMHSDFGRTLTPNSRGGSDHGWGGNSFVLGGAVKGGRIFGEYPSDLTDGGYLNLGRGRVLPTMSYESIWNAISLWFGVKESDLSEVLPNRRSFVGNLFTQEDIFESNHDENSTQPEEKACSVEHLEKTCMFDAGRDSWTPYGRARKYGGYGNSGITNMAAFLLLIVGLFLLCGVATCCWRRSAEKRRQDVSAGDVIL